MPEDTKDLMMRIITLLLLSVVLIGCEKEIPVFKGSPLEREGLFYAPNSTEPLTANVEEYYESGALKKTFSLVAGAKQGLETWWSEKGQLKEEQTYVKGKREGLDQQWHENGQLELKMTMVSDKQEGLSQQWFENGQLLSQHTYVNQKPEGLYQVWHPNGQPLLQTTYVNGKQEGMMQWYSSFESRPPVLLVHGEPKSQKVLAKRIKSELGAKVKLAKKGKSTDLLNLESF